MTRTRTVGGTTGIINNGWIGSENKTMKKSRYMEFYEKMKRPESH